jgi:hypothetical protein
MSGSLQVNTAECILQSSLQLYESEFERAARIMKKVQKGKLSVNDLLTEYDSFISSDGTIKPDSGYHFAIAISVHSSAGENLELSKYYHVKFLMTVESRIRSLLVHLDTILNPQKQMGQMSDFMCLIRPLPRPSATKFAD